MAFSTPERGDTPTPAEPETSTGPQRSPLLAALGAGDAAVAAVARAVADAFSAATSTQKTVQQRVADLPSDVDGLRGRFSGDDLRRALESYRLQVERAYAEFAGRGEDAWGRLREQPQVRQAITTLESYTGRFDARVDALVDEAQDAAARAFAVADRQARATGEQVARTSQRLTGRTADAVVDASASTAQAVEDAGTAAARAVEEAGEETATATRKATRVRSTQPAGDVPPKKRPAAPRHAPGGPASE